MAADLTGLVVALSVVVYCVSVSAVPIYNKKVFSGTPGGLKKFPYPVATAFLQLGLVALVLAAANVAGHLCCGAAKAKSWIFGPNLGYKLRHVGPVGILFGVKYGITNWGLQLMPISMHLLLQSTDLMWTVVMARCINREHFGFFEWIAALLSTTGSVLISISAVQTLEAPLVPLLVNLMTPLFLSLCISTLRLGTQELMSSDSAVTGMTPVEFTAIKLTLSASVALALSFGLEGGEVLFGGEGGALAAKPAWWVALPDQPAEGIFFMLLGAVFVLIFQVNLTWMTKLTSALTVGIVGGLKVVPQWLLNALFQMSINLSWPRLTGAGLILVATTMYAAAVSSPHMLVLRGLKGFEWVPRDPDQPSADDADADGLDTGLIRRRVSKERSMDRLTSPVWIQ